ncbi:hypothetical protein BH11CYA1_BH11CYA1_33990 [soil metagenome]
MHLRQILFKCACAVSVVALCFFPIPAALALDSYRLQHGMVRGLTDLDQNTLHFCDGNLFGLKDESGHEILAPKYSDIEYCGHGLFLATDVNQSNKYYFGEKRHFFNRSGLEQKFSLPKDTLLLNIFSFGSAADNDPDITLNELAADTLLAFGSPFEEYPRMTSTKQGLCNLRGNVLLAPLKGQVLFLKPGRAFIDAPGGRKTVDLSTWQEEGTTLQRNPGTVPRPRIHWPNNYQVQMPFPSDRIRISVGTDLGKFDPKYWETGRDSPIKMIHMFNRFLHEYDLIGMSESDLLILLGSGSSHVRLPGKLAPEAHYYQLPSSGCIPTDFGIKINIKSEKVVSWLFHYRCNSSSESEESDLLTTNVVLDL